MELGSVNVAAVTPHQKEGHQADLGACLELIDFLCSAGVDGIALLGSTGEFVHLSLEDRSHLVRMAAKRSRVPVIAGVSHSTLDGTVALAEQAARDGATAVLILPPYFFRYSQPEVREFFLRCADRVGRAAPIIIYNIPLFTNEIRIETACDLLRSGAFAGIKDSSGRYDDFERLRALRESHSFTLLLGNDVIFTRGRKAGADGGVSGVACAAPELMVGLDRAIRSGNEGKVARLERRLQEFIAWIDRFPAPVGIKEAVAARGLKVGPEAVPLAPESRRCLEEFRSWFEAWLPVVTNEAGRD